MFLMGSNGKEEESCRATFFNEFLVSLYINGESF